MSALWVVIPLFSLLFSFGTDLVAIVINKAFNSHRNGGLPFQYLTDIGAFSPEYLVFSIGVSIGALLQSFCAVRMHLTASKCAYRGSQTSRAVFILNHVALAFSIVASCFCIIFAINSYLLHETLHFAAKYIFFILSFFFLLSTCGVWIMLKTNKAHQDNPHFKVSLGLKLSFFLLYFVAIVIYLPIGRSIACPLRKDSEGVIDYRNCLGEQMLGSVTEHLCFFFVACFYCSFVFDYSAFPIHPVSEEKGTSNEVELYI